MSGVIASFVAYLVFYMHNLADYEAWRWLFLAEALISLMIGFFGILFLVPGSSQTKSWLFPNGYLSEREEKIITNKVLRDDPASLRCITNKRSRPVCYAAVSQTMTRGQCI